jgi:hypothetical protein
MTDLAHIGATAQPLAPSTPTRPKISRSRLGLPSRGGLGWFVLTPCVVAFVYSALLTFKPTRAFAIQMADENYPVEMLTFALLLAGGIYGVRFAILARRRGLLSLWTAFYLTFSVFLLLTGMEEISWGQWFFHFHTPEAIARINTQQEFTLHNLKGLGGHTVWLRLAFGAGGFVGIALGFGPAACRAAFRSVAVPPKLSAWFLVITVFSMGDLVTDYVGVGTPVAALFEVMSEVVELLIAGVGCLYLWLKAKELLGPEGETAA